MTDPLRAALARSVVCSIARHPECDGNAPNGPAGVGSPCGCTCHVRTPDPLRAALERIPRVYDIDGGKVTMDADAFDAALAADTAPLDTAWAEAEAALKAERAAGRGGGFPLSVTAHSPLDDGYTAAASMTEAHGRTPAAALRALAVRLVKERDQG